MRENMIEIQVKEVKENLQNLGLPREITRTMGWQVLSRDSKKKLKLIYHSLGKVLELLLYDRSMFQSYLAITGLGKLLSWLWFLIHKTGVTPLRSKRQARSTGPDT